MYIAVSFSCLLSEIGIWETVKNSEETNVRNYEEQTRSDPMIVSGEDLGRANSAKILRLKIVFNLR